jgi:hypothetical protein
MCRSEDVGNDRCCVVPGLALQPLVGLVLVVAHRDVVGDGVAQYVVLGAGQVMAAESGSVGGKRVLTTRALQQLVHLRFMHHAVGALEGTSHEIPQRIIRSAGAFRRPYRIQWQWGSRCQGHRRAKPDDG